MNQPSLLAIDVPLSEIQRKATLGKAMDYCAELADFGNDKTLEARLSRAGIKVDGTQLSRWRSGTEGVKWEKLSAYMDVCGNDAPLLWMLHQRGYDLHSLRKRETEYQKELREAREEINALRRALHGATA